MNECNYHIAHLSDLHLAWKQEQIGFHDRSGIRQKAGLLLAALTRRELSETISSYGRIYLRALSRALSGRSPYVKPYDGFVITGDLATTGTAKDIDVAVQYFSGQFIPGSGDPSNPPFSFPSEKLAIFPGNHDRYLGRLCSPKSCQFESGKHFGATWDIPARKHSDIRSTVNSAIIRKKPNDLGLAVVGADFSLPENIFPNPLRHLGRGKVQKTIIKQMIAESQRLRREGCGVIWATHFPPVKSRWCLGLSGHQEVVDAAATARVGLILSGHTHIPNSESVAARGTPFPGIKVLTAGTPCSAGLGERSYYQMSLAVHSGVSGPGVRLIGYEKLIYFELPQRNWLQGVLGNIAEFLPAY